MICTIVTHKISFQSGSFRQPTLLVLSHLCPFKAIFCVCVGWVALDSGLARAEIIAFGQTYVYGTGFTVGGDGELEADPALISRTTYLESESLVSGEDEITSYALLGPEPSVYTSSAGFKSIHGDLGVFATASADFGVAGATANWQDRIQLVPPTTPSPGGLAESITSLNFWFSIDGKLRTSRKEDSGYGSAQISSYFNNQQLLFRSIQSIVENPSAKSVSIDIDVTGQLELFEGIASFGYNLDVLSQSGDGFATGSFYETMKLTAITLDDGSTPESLGYKIVFASGMPSPNLNTVPESLSVATPSIGILALVAVRRRDRR